MRKAKEENEEIRARTLYNMVSLRAIIAALVSMKIDITLACSSVSLFIIQYSSIMLEDSVPNIDRA